MNRGICAAWLIIQILGVSACRGRNLVEPTALEGEMVLIPAGWFIMGDDRGPQASRPEHRVNLDAYEIDRTEVTNLAFGRFVQQTRFQPAGWEPDLATSHPDFPAVGILWREAQDFCQWAGKRLPSEAEWEKAARGVEGWRYPWGNDWDPQRANTQDGGPGEVVAVGSYPSGVSPYGAEDMAGNAAEWVADYFDAGYYIQSPDRNPPGPKAIVDHGLRGGSWDSPPHQAQSFFRDSSHSVLPNPRVGFRCARNYVQE